MDTSHIKAWFERAAHLDKPTDFAERCAAIEEVGELRRFIAALPSDAAQAPVMLTDEQRGAIEWAAGRAHVLALGKPIDGVEGRRWRVLNDLFRSAPVAPDAVEQTDKRAAFEAWAKPRRYDLTRCSPEPYAAYKSDLTNGALAGWFAALDSPPTLSTETVDNPVQILSDVAREMPRFEAAMRAAFDYTPERNPFGEVVPHAEEAYQFGRDCDRFMGWCMAASQVGSVQAELLAEVERLNVIINTPQSGDFVRAMSVEAEHQRQRWGSSHDAGKAPSDWFWLVGYLAGKALHAHAVGNLEKAEHHIITTAAALYNWHEHMFGRTSMRPGIDGESALASAGGSDAV